MVFTGKIIHLRPFKEEDIESWYECSKDPIMQKWVGNSTDDSKDDIEKLLFDLYPKNFVSWAIVDNETDKMIGMFRLSHPETDEEGRLIAGESQRLASKYHRMGVMKEVKSIMYPYIFEEFKIDILYADVWEENTNSLMSLKYYGYKTFLQKDEVFSKNNTYQKKLYLSLTEEWWKNSESQK